MADYILDVVNQTSKLDWAFPFQRTGAFPLDRSSLFTSYNDAVLYASGAGDERDLGGSSYIGQTLSVYDKDNSSVTLYIIEVDRSLKEVGSVPLGDNLSVEIIDGIVQLKNFRKNYYAYVPAVKDDEGNIVEASKYVLTEGFKAGLEPRVVASGENLIIAWYEPGSETVEDVAANVESVSKIVDELDSTLNGESGLVNQVDNLKEQVGIAADDAGNAATGLYKEIKDLKDSVDTKANAEDVYTKSETNNAIATAIANVDHLSRKIVNTIDDIDASAEDAHLFIYMVPTGLQYDDDKYDEYVVIDGVVEKVGSWEIDLGNYITKDQFNNLDTKVNTLVQTVSDNKNELDEKILNLQNDLEDEVNRATAAEVANADAITKKADKATTLAGYGITDTYTKDEITDLISDITGGESAADVKAELTAYKTTTDATLDTIQNTLQSLADAEPNYIKAVDATNFMVTDAGELKLVSISTSQVDSLQDLLKTGSALVTQEEKTALQAIIAGNFDNYVKSTTSDFEVSEEGELRLVNVQNSALMNIVGDMTALINYTEGTTLVSEINDLRTLLTWQEMDENEL